MKILLQESPPPETLFFQNLKTKYFEFGLNVFFFLNGKDLLRFVFKFGKKFISYKAFRALRTHLLFQLLTVALSVSIFSLYRKKKFADFIIFFCAFSKVNKKKIVDTNF